MKFLFKTGAITTLSSIALSSLVFSSSIHAEKYDDEAVLKAFNLSLPELLKIIVTVNKQEENLQEVSASVSALSNKRLDYARIENLTHLEGIIPGLRVAYSGSEMRPAMRGANTNEVGVAGTGIAEQVFGIFLDGIYVPTTTAAFAPYIDIERIEVLRGPQGTLYGRNTFAGSANIITKQPEFAETSNADISLTLGNYNQRSLEGIINIPIDDSLATRLVLKSSEHDGYINNRFQAGTSDDLRSEDSLYFRSVTKYQRDDNLSITARVEHFNKDQNSDAIWGYQQIYGYQITETSSGSGIFLPDATVTRGNIRHPSVPLANDFGPYDVYRNALAFNSQNATSATLQFNWLKQNISYQWTTNYQTLAAKQFYDSDYSDIGFDIIGGFGRQDEQKTWSSEFLVSSKEQKKLSWVTGLFLYGQEADWKWLWPEDSNNDGLVDRIGVPSWGNPLNDPHKVNSVAAFGQINYAINQSTRIVTGLRYNKDNKSFTGDNIPDWDDKALLWKAGIEYDQSQEMMLFFSASTGYRTGGANDSRVVARGADALYDNEKVISYEFGLKSSLLKDRMRFNLSTYSVQYSDVKAQLFAISCNDTTTNQTVTECVSEGSSTTFEYYENGGDVDAIGLDVELEWLATKDLNVSLYYGYLNAKFANDFTVGNQVLRPLLGLGNLDGRQDINDNNSQFSFAGWHPAFSPKHSFGLTSIYEHTLENGSILSPYLQLAYVDDYYAFDVNLPETQVSAHLMINALLSWQINQDFTLETFVRNLTDEQVITRAVVHSQIVNGLPANQIQVNWNDPRSWGVSLKYQF